MPPPGRWQQPGAQAESQVCRQLSETPAIHQNLCLAVDKIMQTISWATTSWLETASFYLVLLYKHPGHRYVSVPGSIHERSDSTAVSAVWRVATSKRRSENVRFRIKCDCTLENWNSLFEELVWEFCSQWMQSTYLSSNILTTSSQPCIAKWWNGESI